MNMPSTPGLVRPDDPWCWMIAFGNAIIGIGSAGLFRCYGVFFRPIMNDFDVEYGDVSLMAGLCTGSMAFGALVPAATEKYGSRITGIVAGLIFSFSLLVASLSRFMILMHIFAGITAGFCAGTLMYTIYLTSNKYFVKHRAKATNVATLGTPLGFIVLAPLLDVMIDYYGWRGAMMIISGFTLNSCAAAALYRPLEKESVVTEEKCIEDSDDSRIREECFTKIVSATDCALLCQPRFILMLTSACLYFPGAVGTVFLLVPFGIDELSLTSLNASFLLTLFGAGDCAGRFVNGTIGDLRCIDRTILLAATTFMFGALVGIMSLLGTYEAVAVCVTFQGFFSSSYHGQNSVLYADIVGMDKLSRALGYHGIANNFSSLAVLYLLGLSVDRTGSVKVACYICSGLLIGTSLCLISIYGLKKRAKEDDTKDNNSRSLSSFRKQDEIDV